MISINVPSSHASRTVSEEPKSSSAKDKCRPQEYMSPILSVTSRCRSACLVAFIASSVGFSRCRLGLRTAKAMSGPCAGCDVEDGSDNRSCSPDSPRKAPRTTVAKMFLFKVHSRDLRQFFVLWFAAPSSSIPLTTTRAGLTTLRIIVVSSIHRKTCLWRHQQNSPPSSTSLQRKVDLTIGCTSVDGTVHGSSTWTPSRLGLCSRAMGLQMAPSIFCERLSTDTFRCFAHILSPSFFPFPSSASPSLLFSLL